MMSLVSSAGLIILLVTRRLRLGGWAESSPLGVSTWAAASGAAAGGACTPGELRSLAELDEVKDGEDSEDKEEVTGEDRS